MKKVLLLLVSAVVFSFTSCSGNDDSSSNPSPTSNFFNATIGTAEFATNDIVLAEVSAGGTQAFIATGANGVSFSSALFPNQFPIGQAVNIAYSSSITYKVGDVIYIPNSGTMTLEIMENYTRMKGSFSGTFVGGTPVTEIAISGTFDVQNP